MKQNYTSAATSINKDKLPAVYNRFDFSAARIILDYGCGRFTDHIRAALYPSFYFPYDPYNQPQGRNLASTRAVSAAIQAGQPVTVVCSNVLNVIDSDAEIKSILANICSIVRRSHGRGYITVYEGDKSGQGRQTGPDQWQRNQRTRDYMQFIPADMTARISKNTIIIEEA